MADAKVQRPQDIRSHVLIHIRNDALKNSLKAPGDFVPAPDETGPAVEWCRTCGGTKDHEANSVLQTSDDGYILAGGTGLFNSDGSDAWLIKTDSEGKEAWSKIFGGKDADFAHSVQQTSDGGYIMAGSTRSFNMGAETPG